MSLSPDGSMLATFSNMGNALIWDLETYSVLQTLRDSEVFYNFKNSILIHSHSNRKKTLKSIIVEDSHQILQRLSLEEN